MKREGSGQDALWRKIYNLADVSAASSYFNLILYRRMARRKAAWRFVHALFLSVDYRSRPLAADRTVESVSAAADGERDFDLASLFFPPLSLSLSLLQDRRRDYVCQTPVGISSSQCAAQVGCKDGPLSSRNSRQVSKAAAAAAAATGLFCYIAANATTVSRLPQQYQQSEASYAIHTLTERNKHIWVSEWVLLEN
jgi:hypothetical protein